jgi:hypothetical protein
MWQVSLGAGWIFFFVIATASAKDGSDDSGSGPGSGSGESGKSDPGPRGGDDNGGDWHAHISRSGARVDINGDEIRVIYADGFREEIRKGTLILKDPQGRSVVKRRATAADFTRLRDL